MPLNSTNLLFLMSLQPSFRDVTGQLLQNGPLEPLLPF